MHFELMFHLVLDSQACHLKLQEEERKMHFAMVGTIGLFASMPGAQSPVCLSTLNSEKKKLWGHNILLHLCKNMVIIANTIIFDAFNFALLGSPVPNLQVIFFLGGLDMVPCLFTSIDVHIFPSPFLNKKHIRHHQCAARVLARYW